MRYLALAVDYDGTAAREGKLSDSAAQAFERLRTSGRRSILVTGRRIDDLLRVCPSVGIFDLVRELGLELQVIFNRSAMMLLPPGINKAAGLDVALRRVGLSRHEAVGIGDAENDHSLLMHCECGVAVANAVESLKRAAAFVTRGNDGEGVAELADELIANDLLRMEGNIERHLLSAGRRMNGTEVRIPPYGRNVLIAGPSGSGKSTLTAALIERLIDKAYQVCIIDPEGDYGTLASVVCLGNPQRAPSVNEVLSILEDPAINLAVNLLGLTLDDRPFFFAQLIPSLQAMRARTGRPHWLVLDEAHHMLPQTWGHAGSTLPRKLGETILVTVHPDHLAPEVIAPIDLVFAVGNSPERTLGKFAAATARGLTWPQQLTHTRGNVVAWFVSEGKAPFSMQPVRGRAERIRHHRKYAQGDLRYHSFYFRGPEGRHNLKAQNLAVFCQIATGIDEATWLFHLRRNDYSRWFRDAIRDSWLAEQAEPIERRSDLSAQQTRQAICELVSARYTLPE